MSTDDGLDVRPATAGLLHGRARDRGMVTAELAVAAPVVAGVLVMGISVVALGVDQIRCVDAARIGARALARADPPAQVDTAVRAAAPAGASVAVEGDAGAVGVTVAVTRTLPGGLGRFEVTATSRADREQVLPGVRP